MVKTSLNLFTNSFIHLIHMPFKTSLVLLLLICLLLLLLLLLLLIIIIIVVIIIVIIIIIIIIVIIIIHCFSNGTLTIRGIKRLKKR